MLTKREIVLPWGHPVPSWRSAEYYGRVHFGKNYLPDADEAKSGSILRKIGTLSPGGHNAEFLTSQQPGWYVRLTEHIFGSLKILGGQDHLVDKVDKK